MVVFVGCLTYSCQPCDDCSPEGINPYVKISLINNDSLAIINDSIVQIDSRNRELDQLIPRADNASDSAVLINEKAMLDNIRKRFLIVRTDLSNGLIRIDSIFALSSGKFLAFPDSNTVFPLPLDMQRDNTDYLLKFGRYEIGLSLEYSREELVDNSFFIIRSRIESASAFPVDSIQIIFNYPQAISNETTIKLYF